MIAPPDRLHSDLCPPHLQIPNEDVENWLHPTVRDLDTAHTGANRSDVNTCRVYTHRVPCELFDNLTRKRDMSDLLLVGD